MEVVREMGEKVEEEAKVGVVGEVQEVTEMGGGEAGEEQEV